MTVTIYGYSDDLIEIEGDIEDEIPADDDDNYLAFSDGTTLRIRYGCDDSATWRIERVTAGSATFTHNPANDEGELENDSYSDIVRLEADALTYKYSRRNKPFKK